MDEKESKNEDKPFTQNQISILKQLPYSYGLIKTKDNVFEPVPFSVTPKYFQKDKLDDLIKCCLSFNECWPNLYSQFPKLIKFYKDLANKEELVSIFSEIYEKTQQRIKRSPKPIILLIRNDFMYDESSKEFLQTEYNTMSVSGGLKSSTTTNLMKHFNSIWNDNKLNILSNNWKTYFQDSFDSFLNIYGNRSAYVLFFISGTITCVIDFNFYESCLLEKGINCFRSSRWDFKKEDYSIDEKGNFIFKGREIGVFFTRGFYDESHYDENVKELFITVGTSNCLMLPSMESALLNIKINQLLFFNKTVQKSYGLEGIDFKDFNKNLCPSYHIKTDFNNDKQKLIEFIGNRSKQYMLKTLKEGGFGGVFVGEKMIKFIKENNVETLSLFLLVKKIEMPIQPSYFMVNNELIYLEKTKSELGHFSTFIIVYEDNKYVLKKNFGEDLYLRTEQANHYQKGMNKRTYYRDTIRLT